MRFDVYLIANESRCGRMIRICPSILNANFDDLPGEIARVAQVADLLHLEVMDNVFVPNLTFSLERSLEIIGQSTLPVDVHLMIASADRKAVDFAAPNTSSVVVDMAAAVVTVVVTTSARMSPP